MDLADELELNDELTSFASFSPMVLQAAARQYEKKGSASKQALAASSAPKLPKSKAHKGSVTFSDSNEVPFESTKAHMAGGGSTSALRRPAAAPAGSAEEADYDAEERRVKNMMNTGSASESSSKSSKGGSGTFAAMGLSGPVLSGVSRMNYRLPTPIQRRTLPLTLGGRDVVAMARTGSGKTAAFLIPILERLQKHSAAASGPRALVLAPTRELAQQTLRFARGLGRFTDLRCALLVGGDSIEDQFEALATNPDIIIATPGRLMHLLAEVRDMSLGQVELLVFDEADRLFELGFAEQLELILRKCPEQRQTMLFSATLPKMLVQFARAGLRDPELLRLDLDTKVSDKLKLAFFRVRTEEKEAALLWTLRYLLPGKQQAMIFVSTRQHVELVAAMVRGVGITAEAIYGQLDPDVRRLSIQRFRNRRVRVLVATDVAARGIDMPLLDNVINFHFPDRAKLFVHRCGRVARQGRTGCAISIVAPQEVPYMADVFHFLDRPLASSRDESRAVQQANEAEEQALGLGDTVTVNDDSEQARLQASSNATAAAAASSSSSSSSTAPTPSVASSSAASSVVEETEQSEALALVFDPLSTEPAHVAAAEAAASAARNRYKISTMEPSDVHHGRIPRAQLQPEVEAIAKWDESGGGHEPKALRRAAINGAMQYEKSRKEASKAGVAAARRLVSDASIHPLALGDDDVTATVAQEAAAATLSLYRPHQTVFELEGGRKAHAKRQQAAASMQLLRTVHRGKVNKDAAAIREADKAVAAAMGLASAAAAAAASAAIHETAGEDDESFDMSEGEEEEADSAAETGVRGKRRRQRATAPALVQGGELMAVRAMAGDMGAEVTALPARGGPRMSAAQRRRVKQAALQAGAKAPTPSSSSLSAAANAETAAAVAQTSKQLKMRSARATAELAALAAAGIGGRESWGRKSTVATTGVYRDSSLYIPGTASEAARTTEAALGINAGFAAGTSSKLSAATRASSSMIGAAALEANTLDMLGDESGTMGKNRLQSHWDARKKRFVKLSDQDWAERRGEKRLKLTNGQIVRGDGKEHGEMYRRWSKRSKKRVGTAEETAASASASGISAGGAPLVLSKADYRGGGRVRQHALAVSLGATSAQTKGAAVEDTARQVAEARGEDYDDRANTGSAEDTKTLIKAGKKLSSSGKGVGRELRTEAEIRKLRKEKVDNKLRNMSKDKRRVIMSKERSDILKKRAKRHAGVAGQTKSFKIVRRNT